jgi:hypothetical protein
MDMVTRAGPSACLGLVHVHISGGSYRTMDIVLGQCNPPSAAVTGRPVNHITIFLGPFKVFERAPARSSEEDQIFRVRILSPLIFTIGFEL